MVCPDTSFLVALIRRDRAAISKLEMMEAEGVTMTTTPVSACELFEGASALGERATLWPR